jgi:ATP phosphoribosyltransferase regulatory subunit HisZ
LWRSIEELGLSDVFEIDLGDVSELDYYTALTFKVYLTGAGSRVGGGGRYDRLIANFGKSEPAIGFVLELDALTDVLLRRDVTEPVSADAETDDAPMTSDDPASVLLEARERRRKNERVRVGLKRSENA